MNPLPQTMRALIQKGDGYSASMTGPVIEDAANWLELAEIAVPSPGPGQVLIRTRVAAVNPSDLHFIKGEYGQPREQGKPAGLEGCGEVVAAGDGAGALMGQRVAFVAGYGGSGAWAEYALTGAEFCFPLRPEISDADGAGQIVNPLTAMALVDLAAAQGEAFIATAGASQLGKLMLGLARERGLKAIAIVRRAEVVEPLLAQGAEEVLVVGADDFATRMQAVMKRLKPRVLLDAVADQTSADLFFAMPPRARWVVYGKLSTQNPVMAQMGQLVFTGKRVEGFWLMVWLQRAGRENVLRAVEAIQTRFANGDARTDIAAELTLDDFITRLPEASKLPDGKVMLRFGKEQR